MNGEAGNNTATKNFIEIKSSNDLRWLGMCCCDTDYNIIGYLVSSKRH